MATLNMGISVPFYLFLITHDKILAEILKMNKQCNGALDFIMFRNISGM